MIKHLVAITFLFVAVAVPLVAQDNPNDLKDYSERSMEAAEVLTEIMGIPEDGIPDGLMARAEAVAVIPDMVKGAFGIGGRFGKGLISHRIAGGKWSTPSFIEVGGGSFGLQLGVESTDLILVFTSRDAVEGLLEGKLKVGADASVAAGPVGRKAEIGTDVLLKSPVFSYSRNKGLFAGVALDGAVFNVDDSANRKVYGQNVSGHDILLNGKVSMNAVVRPFVDALEKHSPASKKQSN